MITRAAVYARRIRRWFTRSYWELRVFPLSKSEGTSTQPGLVMVQIDGLSQKQMRRALREGRMPFLKRLLEREHYKEYTHYSGLPSSTPAVQGELFYGVKTCVPSFQFYDRESNDFFTMYDPRYAGEIEKRLARENRPLLQGGSSYSNIFSGGADESHFCAATIGWQGLFKVLNPLTWAFLLIFHIDILLRTLFLLVVELILSISDFIRGVLHGEYILMELQFILTRVLICTLLRELIVLGAKIDIARGLPIIHLNLFGYDEQAHRRGPSSSFAHWSLRGIDGAIARLWKEARLAERREYDLWVYSDHGQEDTVPYPMKYKKQFEDVVEEIVTKTEIKNHDGPHSHYLTAGCCAGRYSRAIMPRNVLSSHAGSKTEAAVPEVAVRGMGPLCHIYPKHLLSTEEKLRIAEEIILKGDVPVVLIPQDDQKVLAVTKAANYGLPEQADAVLGKDHPFLEDVTEDLMNLCFHPNAGQLIISGWAANQEPMTFPVENGSHAGFGSEETRAFAILPKDAPLPERSREHLRPLDIREAALRLLGRGENGVTYETPAVRPPAAKKIRIACYNVHGCMGMDGKRSTGRIARVIARYNPDAVAMQELDAGCSRSENIHQAETIAKKLQMDFHFHPSFCLNPGHYGNGILSQHKMRLVKVGALPQFRQHKFYEPRGVLWVEIDLQGTKVQLLTTHLSMWAKERLLQTEALLSEEWLGHPDCKPPVVLAGDFNASPTSLVYKKLTSKLYDAQLLKEFHQPLGTWLRPYSFTRIDHVLVSPGVKVNSIIAPDTQLDRVASDHFPLFIDLEISAPDAPLKPYAQKKKRIFSLFKRNENGERPLTGTHKENIETEGE